MGKLDDMPDFFTASDTDIVNELGLPITPQRIGHGMGTFREQFPGGVA